MNARTRCQLAPEEDEESRQGRMGFLEHLEELRKRLIRSCIAIAVGIQYLFVFRSPAIVMIATLLIGGGAWLLTRSSLQAFEQSIRYNLGLLSAESGSLYVEV